MYENVINLYENVNTRTHYTDKQCFTIKNKRQLIIEVVARNTL